MKRCWALLALFIALPASAQQAPRKSYLPHFSDEERDTRKENRRIRPAQPSDSDSDDDEKASLLMPDVELIDMPTAGVLDQGGFSSRTRFFSSGGILEWANFGVYPRLNLGASLNMDHVIGTTSPIQVTRPDLQIKLRVYDGQRLIPAFAVGFDGQGYLYNRIDKRYNQRQRGLYAVGSQEIGLPGLQAHAGMNLADFDNNSVFGFMALSYNIADKVLLMSEWDSISNYKDSRVNLGLRVYMTPNFNFDFSVRGVGQGGDYSNGVSRGPERVAQFKYTSNF